MKKNLWIKYHLLKLPCTWSDHFQIWSRLSLRCNSPWSNGVRRRRRECLVPRKIHTRRSMLCRRISGMPLLASPASPALVLVLYSDPQFAEINLIQIIFFYIVIMSRVFGKHGVQPILEPFYCSFFYLLAFEWMKSCNFNNVPWINGRDFCMLTGYKPKWHNLNEKKEKLSK